MHGHVVGTEQSLQQAHLLLAETSGQASWRRRPLHQGLDNKEELVRPKTRGRPEKRVSGRGGMHKDPEARVRMVCLRCW